MKIKKLSILKYNYTINNLLMLIGPYIFSDIISFRSTEKRLNCGCSTIRYTGIHLLIGEDRIALLSLFTKK